MFELESAKNLDTFIQLRDKDNTKVRKLSGFSETPLIKEILPDSQNELKSIFDSAKRFLNDSKEEAFLSLSKQCKDDDSDSLSSNSTYKKLKVKSPRVKNKNKLIAKNKTPVGYDQLDYIIVKDIKKANNLAEEAIKKIDELRSDFDLWKIKDKDKLERTFGTLSQTIKSSLDHMKTDNDIFQGLINKDVKYKEKQIRNVMIDLSLVQKTVKELKTKCDTISKTDVEDRKEFNFSTFSIPEQPSCSTVTSPTRAEIHNFTIDDRSNNEHFCIPDTLP